VARLTGEDLLRRWSISFDAERAPSIPALRLMSHNCSAKVIARPREVAGDHLCRGCLLGVSWVSGLLWLQTRNPFQSAAFH